MIKSIETALKGVVWLLLVAPFFAISLLVAIAEGKKKY